MKFTPLASSSAGCAYKLEGGGTSRPLLLDCGIRFDLIQKALDFKVTELAAVLISHAHGDHVAGLNKMVETGVPCYASSETWAALVDKVPGTLSNGYYQRAHNCHDAKPYTVYHLKGDWTFSAFVVPHDLEGTLGYLIGTPDGSRCLYLTDAAFSPYKFEGLTHVYIECNFDKEIIKGNAKDGVIDMARYGRTMKTHMSIDRLEDFFRANDLSKLQEVHLLHLSNANSNAAKFKKRIQRVTGKPVYIAEERSEALTW